MLVELPQFTVPVGVGGLVTRLRQEGTFPILVHPERNAELQSHPSIAAGFIEHGAFIQVTAMSVTGEFGKAARACAETLLRHNCVHFLATDTHRPRGRPPVLSKGRDAAASLVGEEKARRLVLDNPAAVIEGRPIAAEAPLPFEAKRSLLSRFFD